MGDPRRCLSAETKAKIGAANRGRKRTPEQCAAMSAARRGVKRGPYPPSHGAAVSAAKKGIPQTPAHREANRAARIGSRLSESCKAKLSAALSGRTRPKFSDEWRANIGAAGVGRPQSEATRRKRSQALRAAWEEGRHPVNKSFRYTSLARQLHRYLESIGVSVEPEVRFGRFTVDLYDHDGSVAYEADGSYWHERNEARYPGYHANRDTYLRERFGLTVVRYNEKQIAALLKGVQ